MRLRPRLGRRPVHQACWQLLPLPAPLRADVAHPVTHYLILLHDLVGTVFQNEALIRRLRERKPATAKKQQENQKSAVALHLQLLNSLPRSEVTPSIQKQASTVLNAQSRIPVVGC